VQQCAAGLVNLAVDLAPVTGAASRLTLELPAPKLRTLAADEVAELQAALGTPFDDAAAPAAVDVGPVWLVARYATAQQVLALKPDLARMATLERRLKVTGVTVFGPHPAGSASAIEVRSFASSCGVPEDPVCGSGNGSVAAFQRARDLLPAGDTAYVATQGGCVGRDGRVAVRLNAEGTIWLGGACVTTVEGVLSLGDG
jgi:PhzF family phenazine biosynthesis protein